MAIYSYCAFNIPRAYVYRGVHKETNQIYIGSRCKNITLNRVAHKDFIHKYKTSSKPVKALGFNNFEWEILYEFDTGEEAYDFEQTLIKEQWNNPFLLNGTYVDVANGKQRFRRCGPLSEEQKQKLKGRSISPNALRKLREPKSEEHKKNIGNALKGRTINTDWREKISKTKTGKPCNRPVETRFRCTVVTPNGEIIRIDGDVKRVFPGSLSGLIRWCSEHNTQPTNKSKHFGYRIYPFDWIPIT